MDAIAFPRPLTAHERAILAFVLAVDDPCVEPLRQQANSAVVIGKCRCGCATINIRVDRTTGLPADLGSPAIEAWTRRVPDQAPYELLVFLNDGWLSSLEIVYYTGTPPVTFPPAAAFESPEIIWWAQRDEDVEAFQRWFVDRGLGMTIWQEDKEFVARLLGPDGALLDNDYARGGTPAAAARAAQSQAAASGGLSRR